MPGRISAHEKENRAQMTGAEGKAVLKADRVAKLFGSKLVFRNVSFDLCRGEILLLVGGNGAGKSTLMKIMAGLSRPSAGSCRTAIEPEKTAFLGHATFIYPKLTAVQNLAFWAGMYGLDAGPEELAAVLERVGLSRAAEEAAGGFSRGMAQRLNLARVFLVEPELVFLDEPGTGLDVASLKLLRREISALRDNGASVVWVSHHVAEDLNLADRVLSLADRTADYFGPAGDFVPGGPLC